MKSRFNIVSIKKIKTNKEKESNPTALCDRDFFLNLRALGRTLKGGMCSSSPQLCM